MSYPSYFELLLLKRGAGFHFPTSPPFDPLRPEYLMSNEPIEVISAVLANARAGNFDVFDHLIRIMRQNDSVVIWDCCSNLLSYAGPYSVLKRLQDDFHEQVYEHGGESILLYICTILLGAKALWAVPVVLEIFSLVKEKDPEGFDYVPVLLSYLLERERGLIEVGPSIIPFECDEHQLQVTELLLGKPAEESVKFDEAAYRSAVLTEYSKIKEELADGNDLRVAVFEGDLLSVGMAIRNLLVRLRAGKDTEEIEIGRLIFEASTGINCTSFYKKYGPIQPLAAITILEDFLESGKADKYEPGVRYFFGHRIPD